MGRWGALFRPVDIASIVVFRIALGAFLAWEAVAYLERGWVARFWSESRFHFTYFGFDWVEPWPGVGMRVHVALVGFFALCVLGGLAYRVSAALLFLGFTYTFLLEQARYLNHLYLVVLLTFLMILVPAHRDASFDVQLGRTPRRTWTPVWAVWLLRAQIGIVYVYGGLAKINGDWLRGEPLRDWLGARTGHAIIGPYLGTEAAAYFFSYGGLLFDLLVVPALLWRRSRAVAYTVVVAFHLTNAFLFDIGIFPWLMIAATTIFFEPGWPRRIARVLRPSGAHDGATNGFPAAPSALTPRRRLLVAGLGLYLTVQLLLPLRHVLYPGNVSWTEEGHNFSWHMKLRDKEGTIGFFVTDPLTGRTTPVDPADHLTRRQVRKMRGRPEMILQFAHHLRDVLSPPGGPPVEVRARARISLNGRPEQDLVDPDVDLARVRSSLLPAPWIEPLTTELPGRPRSRP